jgi:hypothetical protein
MLPVSQTMMRATTAEAGTLPWSGPHANAAPTADHADEREVGAALRGDEGAAAPEAAALISGLGVWCRADERCHEGGRDQDHGHVFHIRFSQLCPSGEGRTDRVAKGLER